jgi:hypothetical protein
VEKLAAEKYKLNESDLTHFLSANLLEQRCRNELTEDLTAELGYDDIGFRDDMLDELAKPLRISHSSIVQFMNEFVDSFPVQKFPRFERSTLLELGDVLKANSVVRMATLLCHFAFEDAFRVYFADVPSIVNRNIDKIYTQICSLWFFIQARLKSTCVKRYSVFYLPLLLDALTWTVLHVLTGAFPMHFGRFTNIPYSDKIRFVTETK